MSNEISPEVYRILDASANRAGEGLRTLEEYARFVLDEGEMTAKLKRLRHELASALQPINRQSLLLSRNTPGDVGTEIQVPTEYSRASSDQVIQAAACRTQQSMRVLEEYTKSIDPRISAAIEQIRYRAYTVCADLEIASSHSTLTTCLRRKRLAEAKLYALIDAGDTDDDFAHKVQSLSAAGADIVQLRDHRSSDRVLTQRATIGSQIANEHNTLFIVNDRADIAAAADADGVHVGQDELPPPAVRQIIGDERILGVSTHSLSQVYTAIDQDADYIGCGPVFESQTKSFDKFVGTQFLSEVHQAKKKRALPAFAIGGITLDNVDQVIAAGFHRIAVTGAIERAPDPIAATKQLLQRLDRS